MARNAEHFSTAQSAPGQYKSAIMQHAADAHHHFRSEDIKILSSESGWHERGTREAIAIRAISPSLNRNEGRHNLPHCYDSLIRKVVKKPELPIPHNPSEPLLNNEKRGPGRPRTRPSASEDHTAIKEVASPIVSNSTHTMTTRSRTANTNEGRGLTWLGIFPDQSLSFLFRPSSPFQPFHCIHCLSIWPCISLPLSPDFHDVCLSLLLLCH